MTEQPNALEEFLFRGEGHCKRCGQQKPLAMVQMVQGAVVGCFDAITGRMIPMPRVGFCLECAMAKAAAGDFDKKKKKRRVSSA